jgi:hypothetical protein
MVVLDALYGMIFGLAYNFSTKIWEVEYLTATYGTSLLQKIVNYNCKMFYFTGP